MRFSKIYLEISNICNLRCSFCPPLRRGPQSMSAGDFSLFLEKLRPYGDRLYFHVKGEPLLHPLLGSFLDEARKLQYSVYLTSNGSFLAEKAAILLASPALKKLSVSLQSQTSAESLEDYWRGISAFLDDYRKSRPFPLSLRLWNRRDGNLPPETRGLWELLRKSFPAAAVWEEASAKPALRLEEGIFLNQAELFSWPESVAAQAEAGQKGNAAEVPGFCRGLRDQIAVLADGRVLPCCLDAEGVLELGNLHAGSMAEILASPRARAIYDGFSRRVAVEPLCQGCGYRHRFDET